MGLISKLFTFTNGPGNLIDATQVNADLDALYTLLCGAPSGGTQGQLSKENIAAAFAKANVEPAFSGYKPFRESFALVGSGLANAAYAMGQFPFQVPQNCVLPFRVEPTELVADTRSVLWRLRAVILTNTNIPSINVTVGVAPVTGVAGTGNVVQPLFGSDLAGSTVTFTNPAAASALLQTSGDFSISAANYYVAVLRQSGGSGSAASGYGMAAWLEYKQV